MSRRTLLVLVASGAVLVGFVVAVVAERNQSSGTTLTGNARAKPQTAPLGWTEKQGPKGERIVFGVKWFQVLSDGWRARISLRNDSRVAFGLDRSLRSFGLMLFTSGVHRDLDTRIRQQSLPSLRPALAYEPDLPSTLDPHSTWAGTISAPGALVAGSWVRFVFGTLDAIGRTPDTFPTHLLWITDHAYRLRGSSSDRP